MRHNFIGILILIFGFIGCDTPEFDFDFTHSSPEYLIRGDAGLKEDSGDVAGKRTIPELRFAGGWTSFQFGSGIGEIDPRISALEALEITIGGLNPNTRRYANLGFIQRLELYVVGDDTLPSFLLASFSQRELADSRKDIPLEIHEYVDLLPYTENGLTFQVFLQGHHPQNNVEIHTELGMRGYGRRN